MDAERAFSLGGLTVSKRRHSLGDESIRSATVLASWARAGISSLLPETELVNHIKDKARRPNKGKGKGRAAPEATAGSDSDDVVELS